MTTFKELPVSGEYMHKNAYKLAKKYGKDSLIVIEKLVRVICPKCLR